MTTTRYDVWFDDDGKWRLDTANVTEAEAQEIVEANRLAGYEARIVVHGESVTSKASPVRKSS